MSNPWLNEIDVFDAVQEVQTAQIPVPEAWGLDISPIDGSLFAATFIGDVYQIDTQKLSIIKRTPFASIGPSGYAATELFVLSSGQLALLGTQGGILGVDGASGIVVWDPVTNSLDTGTAGSVCPITNIGAFAISGDRTRVLATTIDEGGGGEPVCSYDPVAKSATMGTFPQTGFVRQIIPTPDGKYFFLTTNLYGVAVFDAKTVGLVGQITGAAGFNIPNAAEGAVLSLDGKTLYLADQSTGAVGAFDTTSLTQTGWAPSFVVDDLQSVVSVAAIDETGLIIGPVGHGVGFIDASILKAAQPSVLTTAFPTPATGPTAGGTLLTNFAAQNAAGTEVLSQIYVGNATGSGVGFASRETTPPYQSLAEVTTPPSVITGAVDLTLQVTDGGIGIAPEGFSFGPTILEIIPNGATADGGQTGSIIGYGLAESTQVMIGGQLAKITTAYANPPLEPYPLPVTALQFTIPRGTAGSAVDVTVSTPSGSATAAGAFHYTAANESHPLSANLQSGLYDSRRDLYYFTDQAQIQVLSRSAGKWLAPLTLPGINSTTQLLAISESPDGSKLAVSDYGGQAIYVLDPDNAASAQRYPMPINYLNTALDAPAGLAITDAGIVYYASNDIGGSGSPAFHKLNTAQGTITNLGGFQSGGLDQFTHVLLSPDSSRIYSNIEGRTFWLDTSDDQIYLSSGTATDSSDFVPDLAISGDGKTIAIDLYIADASLEPQIQPEYTDWETWFPLATTGQKLSQDGSLLIQPLTDGVEMLARDTGRLLYRVQIPGSVPSVFDSLVNVPNQNTVAVITTAGVSFVDLSSLPIPQQDSQPFPDLARASLPRANTALPTAAASRSHENSVVRRCGGFPRAECI